MKQITISLFQEKTLSIQVGFYVVSGLTVAAVQFATFAATFRLFGFQYLTATTIAFVVAVLVSFTLQKYITFAKAEKTDRKSHQAFTLFILNAAFSMLLNFTIMYTGVTLIGLNEFLTQFVSMAILAVYNFAAYRYIFK